MVDGAGAKSWGLGGLAHDESLWREVVNSSEELFAKTRGKLWLSVPAVTLV
jgi:hypothetical protein